MGKVKRLTPSQTLNIKWETLQNPQKTYEALDSGSCILLRFQTINHNL